MTLIIRSVSSMVGINILQEEEKVFLSVYANLLSRENLQKEKLRDLMSMIALNKADKDRHLKFMFYHLWRGEIYTVLDYLRKKKFRLKNEEKYLELIGYLEKHRDEIIDYQLRKKAGK
ncbi:MAG: hypothetical protein IPL59_22240 [Candidatus Competibacteraceae bacterium]|nr:hypothetical protein [Candidatus Competibacteraceae bacterium]